MTDNTTTDFATDVFLADDKPIWHTAERKFIRPKPPFPPDEDIELWLKNNAPLSFEQLADIRYALYHHCSRAEFIVSFLADDQFKLAGRDGTLKIVNDDARHYLLWRLRLLGRKNKWISALPRTRNPRK